MSGLDRPWLQVQSKFWNPNMYLAHSLTHTYDMILHFHLSYVCIIYHTYDTPHMYIRRLWQKFKIASHRIISYCSCHFHCQLILNQINQSRIPPQVVWYSMYVISYCSNFLSQCIIRYIQIWYNIPILYMQNSLAQAKPKKEK